MKVLLLLLLFPIFLLSQSSSNNLPQINSLKILEIDLDNKLSLLDTAVVFNRTFSEKYKFDFNQIMEELIEVGYPKIELYHFLMASNYQNLDSTEDDGIRTYEFSSWCHRDTVDWETADDGSIEYEIEYSNCKIKDIVKLDEKNRLVHYTFNSMGKASSEDYRFDENDRLAEITSPKGHFMLYYDEYNRVERIVEDYENIGNLIQSMGGSLKREITYKFIYE
jgi:hypothetical protein